MQRHRLAGWLAAGARRALIARRACVGRIGPAARQDHHRRVRPAVARRVPAAADQGAEVRRGQQPRHHLRGAAARRLRRPVQLRRVQGRRQRLADDGRPRRRARRQGQLPVQPVRLLGRRRHQQGRDQDAQGPGGPPARRARAARPTTSCSSGWRSSRASTSARSRSSTRPRPACSVSRSPTAPMPCSSGSRPTPS